MIKRNSEQIGLITRDPAILAGKPIIRGTRISVEFILELLSSEMTYTEILEEYPHLEKADIQAALDYAAKAIKNEEMVLTPSK